jgi:hypothetical protein
LAAALGSALAARFDRATALLVAGDGVDAISGRLGAIVVAMSEEPQPDLERQLHELEREGEHRAGNGKGVHQSSWESRVRKPACTRCPPRAIESSQQFRANPWSSRVCRSPDANCPSSPGRSARPTHRLRSQQATLAAGIWAHHL